MKNVKFLLRRFFSLNFIIQLILLVIFLGVTLWLFFALIKNYYGDENNYLKIAISGIFSISAACLTLVRNQEDKNRSAALQYITDKRIDWLKDTREITKALCKNVTYYLYETSEEKKKISKDSKDDNKLREAYSNIMEAIAGLYIRYNFSGERDQILLHLLDTVQFELAKYKIIKSNTDIQTPIVKDMQKEKIRKILELLIIHTQVYLKLEWERIKEETIYEGDINLRRKIIKEKMVRERLKLYKDRVNYEKRSADIENVFETFSIKSVYEELKNKK